MYNLDEFCFVCLKPNNNLQNIITNASIEEKLRCFLPEVFLQSEIPKYVCYNCLEYLDNIYSFRQQCIKNITAVNEYVLKFATTNSFKTLPIPLNIFCGQENEPEPIYAQNIKIEILENEDSNSLYELQGLNNVIKVENILEDGIIVKEETNDELIVENASISQKYEDYEVQFCVEDTHVADVTEERFSDSDFEAENSDIEYSKAKHCPKCPKSFDNNSLLQRHIRTHTGERPFECTVCHKKFTHSGHLNRHKVVHSGKKVHTCEACHKTFNQFSNLKRHQRIHNDDRPFQCIYCDKTFTDSSHCASHLKSHTEEKGFVCHYCPKSYRRTSSLKVHLKNRHNKKMC